MPFVTIEDAHVEYRVEGQGPGLLLIHGTGRDADSNWGLLGRLLAGERTVVRPSFSGSGRTRDRGGPLTLEGLARQAVASAWATGAAPFDVVGIGLGAAVAGYVAATLPDLTRTLVMIAGCANASDPALALQLGLRRELADVRPELLARLMVLNDHGADYLSRLDAVALEDEIRSLGESIDRLGVKRQLTLESGLNLDRVLPGIRCPTLVVAGEQDRLVPPERSAVLADAIPQARAVRLPTGHLAPLEAPERLARVLSELMREGRPETV